ncbi:hypothetical protein OIU78_020988 [Salix suchowensis]|nr:hypothetical protein OIU78_020988 [Salix suchowensis]
MNVRQILCNFKKQMSFQAGFNTGASMCQRTRDNDRGVGTRQHISKAVRSVERTCIIVTEAVIIFQEV